MTFHVHMLSSKAKKLLSNKKVSHGNLSNKGEESFKKCWALSSLCLKYVFLGKLDEKNVY